MREYNVTKYHDLDENINLNCELRLLQANLLS